MVAADKKRVGCDRASINIIALPCLQSQARCEKVSPMHFYPKWFLGFARFLPDQVYLLIILSISITQQDGNSIVQQFGKYKFFGDCLVSVGTNPIYQTTYGVFLGVLRLGKYSENMHKLKNQIRPIRDKRSQPVPLQYASM
jgi:hypothetical protein